MPQGAVKELKLFSLAWPILVEQLTSGFVVMVDIYFLSLLGEDAAATAGLLMPYLWIGFFVLPMLSTGGTAAASQYYGAKQFDKVIPVFMTNVLLLGLAGIAFSIFTYLNYNNIGVWLNFPAAMQLYAEDYLAIMAFTFGFFGLRCAYGSILAAKAMTNWNMLASLLTNVVNVFLNATFFFGWFGIEPMGLKGIALGTVLSYLFACLVVMVIVHVKAQVSFEFNRAIIPRMRAVFKPLMKISIPSAAEPANYTLQQIVVAGILATLGVLAVSSYTFVLRFLFISMAVSWSLAAAGQIMMAHQMGARKLQEVDATYNRCVSLAILFAFVNMCIFAWFYQPLIGLFSDDPQVAFYAKWLLIICIVMEPFRAINIVAGMGLKAVGDGRFAATVGVAFIWGIVPIIYLCSISWQLGIIGAWACFALDEVVRGLINHWRWKTYRWHNMGIV
ncbi:MATE family efflux transporter [Agarivorans sp. 1_MG-2023]|uniref:MATE family efflux transporter n=1 Tax=Agarivorans sp. 1_MG-2023 TaxID=3062634 RepID=UPI0026E3C700|nr:MATE family efflux transporter [Agarivorans sp. 1_MG-2023]MDO6764993.1 MATE family efflux transporter [Agarivorans sp. 1_MG-2023]